MFLYLRGEKEIDENRPRVGGINIGNVRSMNPLIKPILVTEGMSQMLDNIVKTYLSFFQFVFILVKTYASIPIRTKVPVIIQNTISKLIFLFIFTHLIRIFLILGIKCLLFNFESFIKYM